VEAIGWSFGSDETVRFVRRAFQSILILCACVTLLFSAFDLFTGMDLFGSGPPVRVTSLLAMIASVSALFFAMNPKSIHRRTVTLILVAWALAIRIARALAVSEVLQEMDGDGWFWAICVALGPPAIMLLATFAIPARQRDRDHVGISKNGSEL
jgi:hypothetical protein